MRLVSVVLVALAAVACSSPATPEQPKAASRVEAATEKDACSLLDPKEVEAVLGAPLATPPFLSRDGIPTDDGSVCEYEDANLHNITIDVNWDEGAAAFKMTGALQGALNQTAAKGLVHLSEGSDVAGEWDEARVVGCCSFVALRGDQMVTIDVGGSKAPMAAAATLADMALKRLDHQLSISGAHNVQAATTFESAHRPQRRDPCALVTRAEADILVGPLAGDPTSVDDRCVYQHAIEGAFGPTYVLTVRWIGGFREFREQGEATASFAKGFTKTTPLSGDHKQALESALVGRELPANPAWELAHVSIAGLSVVKKDVLVTIEPQGASVDDATKLMEKAMSKL